MSVSEETVARLVRGVIWPGFMGTTAPRWLLRELELGLAGAVYFSQNISVSEAETAELSASIRRANPHALIGVDEEGGNVTRLEARQGSTIPSHAQLGLLDDTAETVAVGVEIARRLRAVGANVALAPVLDVNTNPLNPVIGTRSFGANADLVTAHGIALMRGLHEGHITACVKHYPGHGDTESDSHLTLPTLNMSVEEFRDVHQRPFFEAVAAGARAVMTGHIVVPGYGESPATTNKALIDDLRHAGFTGAVISDALDMAAMRETVGSGAGAVAALQAGVDLLCVGNPSHLGPRQGSTSDEEDYLEIFDAVCEAAMSGDLALDRLRSAANRVRELSNVSYPDSVVTTHRADWVELSQRMIPLHGGSRPAAKEFLILDLRERATFAVASDHDPLYVALSDVAPTKRVRIAESFDSAALDGGLASALACAREALSDSSAEHAVIVVTDSGQRGGPQDQVLQRVSEMRSDAVHVSMGAAPLSSSLLHLDTRAASRLSALRVAQAGLVAGVP
jgi:beta-N-acetylhexosaminidase